MSHSSFFVLNHHFCFVCCWLLFCFFGFVATPHATPLPSSVCMRAHVRASSLFFVGPGGNHEKARRGSKEAWQKAKRGGGEI
jgi:hypothetical protein